MSSSRSYWIKLSVISLSLLIVLTAKAQETIEKIIAWQNDTCAFALTIKESADANFIILSNNYMFVPGPGIPIEGPPVYGTGLISLSSEGEILWQRSYQTNATVQGLAALGRIPAHSFIFNSDGEIVLPYSIYAGILFCDSIGSNTASESFKKSIISIDVNSGDVLDGNSFPDDFLCDKDRVFDIKEKDNGYVWIYQNDRLDSLVLESLDENFHPIQEVRMKKYVSTLYLDKYEDYFLIASLDELSFFDFNLEEVMSIEFSLDSQLYSANARISVDDQYIALALSGKTQSDSRASSAFIMDREGNLLFQEFFPGKDFIDIAFTVDHQILVLSDNSKSDFYDSLSKPVRVSLLSLDLNLMAEKDYGFPFVHPEAIIHTNDNGFAVAGTRFKSILDAPEEAPDELYFLRDKIDHLLSGAGNPVSQNDFHVYPNPVSSELHLQAIKGDVIVFDYQLLDGIGNLIKFKENVEAFDIIDMNELPAGVYLLRIQNESYPLTRKIVKH